MPYMWLRWQRSRRAARAEFRARSRPLCCGRDLVRPPRSPALGPRPGGATCAVQLRAWLLAPAQAGQVHAPEVHQPGWPHSRRPEVRARLEQRADQRRARARAQLEARAAQVARPARQQQVAHAPGLRPCQHRLHHVRCAAHIDSIWVTLTRPAAAGSSRRQGWSPRQHRLHIVRCAVHVSTPRGETTIRSASAGAPSAAAVAVSAPLVRQLRHDCCCAAPVCCWQCRCTHTAWR